MAIEFVYFDVGGVLIKFSGGLRAMAKKHGLEYSDFERVFRNHDDQICRGEITPQELWEIYQRELGFSEPNINFLDYWVSKFNKVLDTHELIYDLSKKGVPIGLLTNIYPGVYEKALLECYIPNVDYNCVVSSCKVHFVKPENEIYQIAQSKTGVSPDNILFIDDKPNFLEPALKLGWQTVLFDENNPSKSVEMIKKLF